MIRKILHPVLALALAAGLATTSVEQAAGRPRRRHRRRRRCRHHRSRILGCQLAHAAYAYDDYDDRGGCYRGPRRCHWEDRRCFENRYGDTVCRGGDHVCRRPLVCD